MEYKNIPIIDKAFHGGLIFQLQLYHISHYCWKYSMWRADVKPSDPTGFYRCEISVFPIFVSKSILDQFLLKISNYLWTAKGKPLWCFHANIINWNTILHLLTILTNFSIFRKLALFQSSLILKDMIVNIF